MKSLKIIGVSFVILPFLLSFAIAGMEGSGYKHEGSEHKMNMESINQGKTLFEDYGCTKCHPNGMGLTGVAGNRRYKDPEALNKMINSCIKANSNKPTLTSDSKEMENMRNYIQFKAHHPGMKGSVHKGSETKESDMMPHRKGYHY